MYKNRVYIYSFDILNFFKYSVYRICKFVLVKEFYVIIKIYVKLDKIKIFIFFFKIIYEE